MVDLLLAAERVSCITLIVPESRESSEPAAMSLKVSRLLSDLRPSRVTAEEVIGGQDLSDKTVVVTGGNSGTTSHFEWLPGRKACTSCRSR